MSAMIYVNGAWQEAETPKRWNGSAFEDTEGYCWENGTQKEGWNAKVWLVKDGIFQKSGKVCNSNSNDLSQGPVTGGAFNPGDSAALAKAPDWANAPAAVFSESMAKYAGWKLEYDISLYEGWQYYGANPFILIAAYPAYNSITGNASTILFDQNVVSTKVTGKTDIIVTSSLPILGIVGGRCRITINQLAITKS